MFAAIKAHREASAPIAQTAKNIVRTVHTADEDIHRFAHHVGLVAPHAAGTAGQYGQALAETVESLITALGADGVAGQTILLNYTRNIDRPATFEAAARMASEQLERRL